MRVSAIGLQVSLLLAGSAIASGGPRPPRQQEAVRVVVQDAGVIQAIAVDGPHVFWSSRSARRENDGRVSMALLSGGGAVTVLADGQVQPQAIATDARSVYWINVGPPGRARSGQLMRISKRGGRPVVLASGLDVPRGLALDQTHVYVASQGRMAEADAKPPRGRIQRFLKTGGSPVDLAGPQFFPTALSVDESAVYFTTKDALLRLPKTGGKLNTVIDASAGCTQPVNKAGLFCWTRASHDGFAENPLADLLYVAKSTSAPQPQPQALLRWQDSGFLAADAAHIYISSVHQVGKREVLSLPRGGGLPSLLAYGEHAPEEIVCASGRLLGISRPRRQGTPSRIVEVMTVPPRGALRAGTASSGRRASARRRPELAPADGPCNGGRRVPGEVIVRLNASSAEPMAASIAADYGLRVEQRHLYPFLPGFGARATRDVIEALRHDERVGEVAYVCRPAHRPEGGRP